MIAQSARRSPLAAGPGPSFAYLINADKIGLGRRRRRFRERTNEQTFGIRFNCCCCRFFSNCRRSHAIWQSNSRQFGRSSRWRLRHRLSSRPLWRMSPQRLLWRSLLGRSLLWRAPGNCGSCRTMRRPRGTSSLRPIWKLPDGMQLLICRNPAPPRRGILFAVRHAEASATRINAQKMSDAEMDRRVTGSLLNWQWLHPHAAE